MPIILTPAGGSSTTDTIITLTGTSEPNSAITVRSTDNLTLLATTTTDGAGNWTATTSSLPLGPHMLRVQATDLAGNTSPVVPLIIIIRLREVLLTGPTIISLTPEDGAREVATNTDLTLHFSEPVTIGTGNIMIRKFPDGIIAEVISVTSGQVT